MTCTHRKYQRDCRDCWNRRLPTMKSVTDKDVMDYEESIGIKDWHIKRMWKILPPSEANHRLSGMLDGVSIFGWDRVYGNLEHCADRWDFNRLYTLYLQYLDICKDLEAKDPLTKIIWKR